MKYKHRQVMKLCIMTDEDVFNDKTSTDELMEIVSEAIRDKRFYFELINPQKKENG
jgi:hypothetical protein|tara:strand:- start:806 stop:973 length:168 start_codon:yes stop_codon:yes gene_type:complete